MYVAEIISCRQDWYWSSKKIGQFYEITDENIFELYKSSKDYFKISDYMTNNNIVDKNKCKIVVHGGFLDLCDVKIHNARSLKIKKLKNDLY